MEGLLIAEQLELLKPLLPSKRLSWRFLDAHTFVLPLTKGAIWLYSKPPQPRLAYKPDMPAPGSTFSGFQDLLVAKAAGDLLAVEQLKLDRVLKLHFAPAEGFVSTPAVTLIAELTGRNCNLILTDSADMILGLAREVAKDINRFRQLRSGLRYLPPPPYQKLDPRQASDEELSQVLLGRKLKELSKLIDGFGLELSKTLAITAGLPLNKALIEEEVNDLLPLLRQVSAQPSRMMQDALSLADIEVLRKSTAKQERLQRLTTALKSRQRVLQKRLEDIDKARQAAAEAGELRHKANVLMAYGQQLKPKTREVMLSDFEGRPLKLKLDPRLDAIGNAQQLYERAKKREHRKIQAESREAELLTELKQIGKQIETLAELESAEIDKLSEQYLVKPKGQFRAELGIRYTSPQGYTVLVGRNAKENDIITFKLAKSRDMWLHAQGYPGSHVVIQAQGKELPFETVLFAAQLAAAYSKAGQSDNVPVDYALRKNVWKVKGAPPGAVNISQQKTVYVMPSRRPSDAEKVKSK